MVSTGMREREIKGEREREKKREREREWGERKRERERGRERDRKTRECLHSRWPSQGPAQAELSRLKKKSLSPLFSWKVPQALKTHMDANYVLISILSAPEVSVNNTHPRSQLSVI